MELPQSVAPRHQRPRAHGAVGVVPQALLRGCQTDARPSTSPQAGATIRSAPSAKGTRSTPRVRLAAWSLTSPGVHPKIGLLSRWI
eukprot:4194215-Pyramimonas_sp.AAC.1